MPTWAADHFRLTAFGVTDAMPDWRTVTGAEADTISADRRLGTAEEQGDFRGFRLVAGRAPGRADWRVSAEAKPGILDLPEPIPFDGAKAAIDAVAEQLFGTDWAPVRVALGAVLYAPAASREDGYRQLAPLLRSVTLDPRSEDFTFQINWPRTSKVVPGLKVNRITGWLVEQRTFARFAVGEQGVALQPSDPVFRCRLAVDLSTEVRRQEALPGGSLQNLWRELGELAVEIANEGEVQ